MLRNNLCLLILFSSFGPNLAYPMDEHFKVLAQQYGGFQYAAQAAFCNWATGNRKCQIGIDNCKTSYIGWTAGSLGESSLDGERNENKLNGWNTWGMDFNGGQCCIGRLGDAAYQYLQNNPPDWYSKGYDQRSYSGLCYGCTEEQKGGDTVGCSAKERYCGDEQICEKGEFWNQNSCRDLPAEALELQACSKYQATRSTYRQMLSECGKSSWVAEGQPYEHYPDYCMEKHWKCWKANIAAEQYCMTAVDQGGPRGDWSVVNDRSACKKGGQWVGLC